MPWCDARVSGEQGTSAQCTLLIGFLLIEDSDQRTAVSLVFGLAFGPEIGCDPRMRFWSFALCLSAVSLQAQQRVEVSRDLWISSYSKEVEGNNGGSHKLKLKGIQEFFLIDFDPAPFRGKKDPKRGQPSSRCACGSGTIWMARPLLSATAGTIRGLAGRT